MLRETRASKALRVGAPPSTSGCCGWVGHLRLPVYVLVRSRAFELLMTIVVLANAAAFTLDHHGVENEPVLNRMLNSLSTAFATAYYVEFGLKIIGLGPRSCALHALPPRVAPTSTHTVSHHRSLVRVP